MLGLEADQTLVLEQMIAIFPSRQRPASERSNDSSGDRVDGRIRARLRLAGPGSTCTPRLLQSAFVDPVLPNSHGPYYCGKYDNMRGPDQPLRQVSEYHYLRTSAALNYELLAARESKRHTETALGVFRTT